MYNLLKTIVILSAFFIVKPAYGQFSTFEIYGTRANGLADINTVFTNLDASYGNIAGLSGMNGTQINIHYQNRFGFTELKVLGMALGFNHKKAGAFAVTLKDFGIEEYNEFEAGIAYARKLTSTLSAGVQFNFFNLAIQGYGNTGTFSFNAGIQYGLTRNLLIGFSVKNPFPVKFTESSELPTIIAAGMRYNVSEKVAFFSEIEKHINYEYTIKIAIQYHIVEPFTGYFGYFNSPSTYAGYSFGFSYSGLDHLNIEVSTKYNITLGLSPSIGITYKFTSR